MKTKKEDSKISEIPDNNAPKKIGHYFTENNKDVQFFSSGCTQLDCALGGGWAEGRICNVIGDESTGKSLTAIEACINYLLKYPEGKIIYYEVEAAFDKRYAKSLGLPIEKVIFGRELYNEMVKEKEKQHPYNTVECLYNFLQEFVKLSKESNIPILFVIDSLDAISDIAEQEREIGDSTYGSNKAKQLSQLFRRWGDGLAEANFTLMIISQVRDKIGVTFGDKTDCSGGRALKFYASQRLKLAELQKVPKTIDGITLSIGTKIKAKVIKNKVNAPYREWEYTLIAGYGIDNVESNIRFLEERQALDQFDFTKYSIIAGKTIAPIIEKIKKHPDRKQIMKELGDLSTKIWNDIAAKFLPENSKY